VNRTAGTWFAIGKRVFWVEKLAFFILTEMAYPYGELLIGAWLSAWRRQCGAGFFVRISECGMDNPHAMARSLKSTSAAVGAGVVAPVYFSSLSLLIVVEVVYNIWFLVIKRTRRDNRGHNNAKPADVLQCPQKSQNPQIKSILLK